MALGAFLAGVLLAESAYRYQIEADIEPFRGLLLGLFFISIGMRVDISAVVAAWWIVLGGAAGLIIIKAFVLSVLARMFGCAQPVFGEVTQGCLEQFVVRGAMHVVVRRAQRNRRDEHGSHEGIEAPTIGCGKTNGHR